MPETNKLQHRTRILVLVIFLAATTRGRLSAQTIVHAPDRLIRSLPAESALVVTATVIESLRPRMNTVWPGYWSEPRQYMLARSEDDTIILLAHMPDNVKIKSKPVSPGSPYRLHYGGNAAQSAAGTATSFDMINRPPMLRLIEDSLYYSVGFVVHEEFHRFQAANFRDFFCTMIPYEASAYAEPAAAAMESERAALTRAVNSFGAARIAAIREFLTVRRSRTSGDRAVNLHEKRMERQEGTARYVGWMSESLLSADTSLMQRLITAELSRPFSDLPQGNESRQQGPLSRWRTYGTGAAQAYLLDQLRPGWKLEAQKGAFLDELLGKSIGETAAPFTPPTRECTNALSR